MLGIAYIVTMFILIGAIIDGNLEKIFTYGIIVLIIEIIYIIDSIAYKINNDNKNIEEENG